MQFAIVDIETTGGNQAGEKITEIAIYIHDGIKIIDSFHTLVNPEKSIPWNITRVTGITDKMVADAPRFFEIAKKIVEITEGKVFVAHNVAFDYNFIRREFKTLGYEYKKELICTVKLSRKVFPGFPSYSLGKLCHSLNINLENRHRADGDALATTKLFEMLVYKDTQEVKNAISSGEKNIVKGTYDTSLVENLPEKCGVYYFYNDKNEILYIGKSRNIKKRVITHLTSHDIRRAQTMKAELAYINYEVTGSELVALLLESHEIKNNQPKFNRAQRKVSFPIGLFARTDTKGYQHLSIEPITTFENPLISYSSVPEAKEHLFKLVEKYKLCQKMCGLYQTDGACFGFQIGDCKGACVGNETPEEYNVKVNKLIREASFQNQSLLIIDKGRDEDEKSVVYIQNGLYIGFAFFDTSANLSIADLQDIIVKYSHNKDTQQIIHSFLRSKKVERIIYLKE